MDHIDAVNANPYPWAADDRAAVLAAVAAAAAESGGEVHAATVRAHLSREVGPHVIGAVICALVRQGVLVGTGTYRHNGGSKSRNRTKPAEVRRLVRPIPPEALAA